MLKAILIYVVIQGQPGLREILCENQKLKRKLKRKEREGREREGNGRKWGRRRKGNIGDKTQNKTKQKTVK